MAQAALGPYHTLPGLDSTTHATTIDLWSDFRPNPPPDHHRPGGGRAQTGRPRSNSTHDRKTSAEYVVYRKTKATMEPLIVLVRQELGARDGQRAVDGGVIRCDAGAARPPERSCTRAWAQIGANDAPDRCTITTASFSPAGITHNTRAGKTTCMQEGSAQSRERGGNNI